MASVSKSPPPAELPLFRFGLRHLFAFVAVICALLTEVVASSGVTGLILVVVTLVVIAHVTATALGSRLRAAGTKVHDESWRTHEAMIAASPTNLRPVLLPRPPIWYGRDTTQPVRMPLLVTIGMAAGGISGLVFLMWSIGDHTTLLGLAVGAISVAILGGWFAFLASSFYSMFRRGWREAVEGDKKSERTAEH